ADGPMVLRCLTLALLCAGLAQAADPPMTLEAALDSAMARNERSLKTPERVEVAAGGVDRARTAVLPALNRAIDGVFAEPSDRDGRNLSGSAVVSLNQPIINPPSIPLWRQAKHAYESERWGAIEDLRLLLFDTTNSFLTTLTNESLLAAAKNRL